MNCGLTRFRALLWSSVAEFTFSVIGCKLRVLTGRRSGVAIWAREGCHRLWLTTERTLLLIKKHFKFALVVRWKPVVLLDEGFKLWAALEVATSHAGMICSTNVKTALELPDPRIWLTFPFASTPGSLATLVLAARPSLSSSGRSRGARASWRARIITKCWDGWVCA